MMTLRSLLFILFLIGLARYCELAPSRSKNLSNDKLSSLPSLLSSSSSSSVEEEEEGEETSSSSRKRSRGTSSSSSSSSSSSPSELTWEAWLLVDAQAGDQSSLDSANILRKITPKSIFFAPTRIDCAEGYRADTMDRCVKDVKIDHEAQFDFLLKRVSAMYLQRFASSSNGEEEKIPNQKQSSGPLQLSIPLLGIPLPPPSSPDAVADDPVISSVNNQQPIKNEDDRTNEPPKETTVTIYEAKIETTTTENEEDQHKLDEEEIKPLILLDNINHQNNPINKDSKKSEEIVPVAEFVDETNGSSGFSEIVDYKIPINLKAAILNVTNVKNNINESEVINDDTKLKEVLSMNVSNITPTLVFLLTPTKQPQIESSSSSSSSSSSFEKEDGDDLSNVTTAGHVIIRMTESINSTNHNMDQVINESNSNSLKKLSENLSNFDDKVDNNGNNSESSGMKMADDDERETTYEDETVDEGEIVEEEDDYVDPTDNPIEDELTELEGEILKHGEAGITIPVTNLDRLHLNENHETNVEPMIDSNMKNVNYTFDSSSDEIAIRFNHSISNMDEHDSKISSEATIKDDVIIETTLLNVNNPTKIGNNSKFNNTKINDDENVNEHFESEKIHDTKTKIIFPTEEIPTTTIVSTSTKENIKQQVSRIKFIEEEETDKNPTDLRNVELLAEPSSSESLLYDPHFDNRYLEATIKETEDSVKTSNSFSTRNILDLEGSPNFDVRSSQNYVKFPSDEINSIHNQDYKDGHHQHRNIFEEEDNDNDNNNPPYISTTSTKSSIPNFHQKSSYSRTPIGWRINRPEEEEEQQQQQQQEDNERHRSVVVVQRQKPRPMYLYRTKAPPPPLPLTRISPNLFSIGQGGSRSTPTIMDRGYRNDYVRVSSRRRVKY